MSKHINIDTVSINKADLLQLKIIVYFTTLFISLKMYKHLSIWNNNNYYKPITQQYTVGSIKTNGDLK